MKRPNILWICTDQQRWDTLGCYGNKFVRTPNIDRLAEDGVMFSRFYTQNPVCVPSRASFLTGRYPRTNRTRRNTDSIPAEEVLVTRILADAGYTCGLSGKLHVSIDDPETGMERRIEDGYSEFYFSPVPGLAWPGDALRERGLQVDQTAQQTNQYTHWLGQHGLEYDPRPFEDSKWVQVGMEPEYGQTTWCSERAIEFIERNASSERPWLFSVNPFDPHHPFDPPAEYLERYLECLEEIPLPNYVEGELEGKPVVYRLCHEGAYNVPGKFRYDEMGERDHRLIRAAYWAMVDLIDAQVGRMLEALERTGQLEDTLVIFTSDHGEMLGDHGVYCKGPFLCDPGVRVPLVMSWRGVIGGGRRSGALVEAVDLAPTLLEAVGLPGAPGMDGRSLWPLLMGTAQLDHHRDDVYSEYHNSAAMMQDLDWSSTMVRTERYKLVAVHGRDRGELYDLEEDPEETHNRWDDDRYQAVKVSLLKRLCDRMD
jgi:arylsulfatase A-like enzyme